MKQVEHLTLIKPVAGKRYMSPFLRSVCFSSDCTCDPSNLNLHKLTESSNKDVYNVTHVDNADLDQKGRLHRLIWFDNVHKSQLVYFFHGQARIRMFSFFTNPGL